MSLRQAGLGIILSLGLSLGSTVVIAQPNLDSVEIKTIPIAEGIYMLMGEGGNIGVSVGEDGTFIVDDQFAPLSDKIKAAIAQLTDKPVKFVLNTHWHFDHIGGNENFADAGAIIVAHDNVRQRMATEQVIEALGRTVPPSPEGALPMVTFQNGTTFHMNDLTIGVQHLSLPAHTDGDSIVYFEEANVLHTGDTYFNGSYPFIDTSSGGSLLGMITAAEQMLAFTNDETQIIPGHGPLSNKAELEVYTALLKGVQDKVNTAIASGLTVEEFIASNPTAQYDESWGSGFVNPSQFLTILYNDALTRSQ
jgi:cyclase